MPDYVFLTGHRKAGTTLLMSLFDGHPSAVSYPSDIGLLYAYFPAFTGDKAIKDDRLRARIELVLQGTLGRIKSENDRVQIDVRRFTGLFWKHFTKGDLRSRPAVLDALGKAWCEYQGKPLDGTTVIFKETSQAIFFDELSEALPALKMINLVRDPRDNYAALKAGVTNYYSKLGENEMETLASVINRARMDMIAAKTNAALHPKSFAAVRFEDLVSAPEAALRPLCDFLGWKFDAAMLTPTVQGVPQRGNSHEGKAFKSISAENSGAWKSRIAADEAKVIEYWCSREMSDWNYQLAFPAAESQRTFSEFYSWYNSRYFFRDSFVKRSPDGASIEQRKTYPVTVITPAAIAGDPDCEGIRMRSEMRDWAHDKSHSLSVKQGRLIREKGEAGEPWRETYNFYNENDARAFRLAFNIVS